MRRYLWKPGIGLLLVLLGTSCASKRGSSSTFIPLGSAPPPVIVLDRGEKNDQKMLEQSQKNYERASEDYRRAMKEMQKQQQQMLKEQRQAMEQEQKAREQQEKEQKKSR